MYRELSQELFSFIEKCPSCFHTVDTIANLLLHAGYKSLSESSSWDIQEGGNYYVTRNCSSIIAFQVPTKNFTGFQIAASHSDAPSFKLKEQGEMDVEGKYTRLNVEGYGGMICSSWFDRPLSLAGRVVIQQDHTVETKLVNLDKDLLMIPNLAIHMNREANQGYTYNVQKDMLPLFGDGSSKGRIKELVAEACDCLDDEILSWDLFLYNRTKGYLWGDQEAFIASPRLDDLQCAFSSLKAFLSCESSHSIPVLAVFDNEEVGSGTKQGAASTFLYDVLTRLNNNLGRNNEDYLIALASSFMVSADNGHGLHPNYPDKADPTNRPVLNGGVLIKSNAGQKYTTDAISQGIFTSICQKAAVPFQHYVNRSDLAGGSTLGNISNHKVSLNTVDIGLAQLGMHSAVETGGVQDTWYLTESLKQFFSCSVKAQEDGRYSVTFE